MYNTIIIKNHSHNSIAIAIPTGELYIKINNHTAIRLCNIIF